jgi:hypothetical protein
MEEQNRPWLSPPGIPENYGILNKLVAGNEAEGQPLMDFAKAFTSKRGWLTGRNYEGSLRLTPLRLRPGECAAGPPRGQ